MCRVSWEASVKLPPYAHAQRKDNAHRYEDLCVLFYHEMQGYYFEQSADFAMWLDSGIIIGKVRHLVNLLHIY